MKTLKSRLVLALALLIQIYIANILSNSKTQLTKLARNLRDTEINNIYNNSIITKDSSEIGNHHPDLKITVDGKTQHFNNVNKKKDKAKKNRRQLINNDRKSYVKKNGPKNNNILHRKLNFNQSKKYLPNNKLNFIDRTLKTRRKPYYRVKNFNYNTRNNTIKAFHINRSPYKPAFRKTLNVN